LTDDEEKNEEKLQRGREKFQRGKRVGPVAVRGKRCQESFRFE
jgi:hypothetical protein